MTNEVGKILAVRLGSGGYQEAMFGFTFDLGQSGSGWGCSDFWGTWAERSPSAKWTLEEQRNEFGRSMDRVKQLMIDAKVGSFEKLVGKPIKAHFSDMRLVSWEIYKEVL